VCTHKSASRLTPAARCAAARKSTRIL
jgi:hypothetical protein